MKIIPKRSSRQEGRQKLNGSFLDQPRGIVAAKECSGRGEKEFFDASFESIKKLWKGSARARSMAGRQRAEDLLFYEGRSMSR